MEKRRWAILPSGVNQKTIEPHNSRSSQASKKIEAKVKSKIFVEVLIETVVEENRNPVHHVELLSRRRAGW